VEGKKFLHKINKSKANLIDHILRSNRRLKLDIKEYKRRENEDDGVNVYWMTLQKGKVTGN
jgi:hypothetical protein